MVAVPAALAPVVYGLLNIASATGIVFANKAGERGRAATTAQRAPRGLRGLPAARATRGGCMARRSRAPFTLGTAAAAGAAASAPLLRPACHLQSSASSASTSPMPSRSYTRSPPGWACKASCG